VIDDDDATSYCLAALLRADGYQAWTARSGPEGVEAGRSIRPDVVVLDLALPGLNGWDVAKCLRSSADGGKQPFIVALSGYSLDEDRRRSAAVEFDLHLVKPVEPHALLGLLHRFRSLVYDDRGGLPSDGRPDERD
jgi:CheY-like chemotaxis protein